MGYRISWLAAQGLSTERLLEHFGLQLSDEPDEANEAPFSFAALPTGWTVLWSNDPTFAKIEYCQPLSRLAPVVSCWVNETMMFSSANYFDDDQYLWFVGHDAQKGIYNLEYDGELPPQFEAINGRLNEQQDAAGGEKSDVDFMFDVPLELAQSICGFKHDCWKFDWGEPKFFVANIAVSTNGSTEEKTGSWFSRLLGKTS